MAYNSLMLTTLRLPLSGYKHWSTGEYWEGTTAQYWTTNPSWSNGGSSTHITPPGTNQILIWQWSQSRNFWFSVRCLKN
jgi:hypothetical protein